MTGRTIAVLATLDTKGREVDFLRERLARHGCRAMVVDLGVRGEPGTPPDVPRDRVAAAAGASIEALASADDADRVGRTMAEGAARWMLEQVTASAIDGVLGLGGLRGTAACTHVMRALPYGFPKVMVSTVASGDTSAYVGVKDVTMMFSVGDVLGLNALTRRILANAAAAVAGMADVELTLEPAAPDKPLIAMSNLGVLTRGAMRALERFESRGYEVVVFHAVGSGGRAMEELMRQGVVGAVFDYAMGEISDDVFEGLRAGGPTRLTIAGALGLPQVLCPGGCEHLGVLVDPPNSVPERYRGHTWVFHNPVVFVPRLKPDEMVRVAEEIAHRLATTRGNAVMMLPLLGTGRYAMPGGPLRDVEGDRAFFAALEAALPDTIEVVRREAHAEDDAFVDECVDRLIALIEARS